MKLIKWEPFSDFLNLERELTNFLGGANARASEAVAWTPAVDVLDKGDKVVVKADLPEVNLEDVEVTMEKDHLVISGERKFGEEVNDENYFHLERSYGVFKRVVAIGGDIKRDDVKATFDRGVLEVVIPKAEEAKSHKVEIESGVAGQVNS